jgi:hypothetical protein
MAMERGEVWDMVGFLHRHGMASIFSETTFQGKKGRHPLLLFLLVFGHFFLSGYKPRRVPLKKR